MKTTFALALASPYGLAFDGMGKLSEADGTGNLFGFTRRA